MKQSIATSRVLAGLAFVAVSIALVSQAVGQEKSSKRSSEKTGRAYTIAKDTTYFQGPFHKDGTIDFLAAVNEHYSQGVTQENNAARIIVPLTSNAEFGPMDMSRRDRVLLSLGLTPSDHPIDKAFQDVGPYFDRNVPEIQEFEKQYSEALARPWTALEFPKVAKWLADNESALNRIAEGATKEKYFVPWIVEGNSDALFMILLDHVQANRSVARALQARAHLQIGEQNWEGAWNDVLTIRNLGRLIGQGPSLVEGLVGIAITSTACETAKQFITAAEPDSIDWTALQDSWTVAPIARISEALGVAERAMMIQVICRFADNPDQAADNFQFVGPDLGEFGYIFANKAFARTLFDMVHSGDVPLDDALRFVNQMYDRAVGVSKMTDARARLESLMQLEDEVAHTAREGEPSFVKILVSKPEPPATQFAKTMLTMIFPSVEAVHAAEWRGEGTLHVVELALAARGVQARTGDLPGSLRELEPWVDRAVMEQPLTGDLVVVQAEQGGLSIYHWSHNRQNDGGDIDGDNPKDWGIRLR